MQRYDFDVHEGTLDKDPKGEYVKYDDMLLYIFNSTSLVSEMADKAVRELIERRNVRIVELEAQLVKAKEANKQRMVDTGNGIEIQNSDGSVAARIGKLDDKVSAALDNGMARYGAAMQTIASGEVESGVAKAAEKVQVSEETEYSLSIDKLFIKAAVEKAIDAIRGADFSALGDDELRYSHSGMFAHGKDGQLFINKGAIGSEGFLYAELARADDVLRADIEALKARVEVYDDQRHAQRLDQYNLRKQQCQRISSLEADTEALKESLESNYDLHEKQVAAEIQQNNRINALEDAFRYAGSNKGKGRNAQTYLLEEAMRRVAGEALQDALKPGGLLHKY